MGQSMNILLVEDNDHRRVTILKHLLSCGHRVTPSSSVEEAEEILQFVEYPETPADVVVIAKHLMTDGGADFRAALDERFDDIRWIMFPWGRDLAWLSDRLDGRFGDTDEVADQGLNILLIEADDARRQLMAAHLLDRQDRITACSSVREATEALSALTDRARTPHAIVSDVGLSDGNGLSFYLAASRRFPDVRWIVTPRPVALPAAGVAGSVELPLDVALVPPAGANRAL
jgi:CheY-like chemotaxis protein